ncbi:MAG TPA: nucleotidyl transferase AbiEii/AbiGii toxin family protein, partial [Anaerolineae bacterium]|nr:nucleotidyl transferase AbiEii/AbiGii toxin family protein [Anaerolineae bacterium]
MPATPRRLIHVYTDADVLEQVELPCYALEEILAEKIRAVSGQRRFAISRDLYDNHRLVQAGVSVDKAVALLPAKFAARGVDPAEASVD